MALTSGVVLMTKEGTIDPRNTHRGDEPQTVGATRHDPRRSAARAKPLVPHQPRRRAPGVSRRAPREPTRLGDRFPMNTLPKRTRDDAATVAQIDNLLDDLDNVRAMLAEAHEDGRAAIMRAAIVDARGRKDDRQAEIGGMTPRQLAVVATAAAHGQQF